MNCDNPTPRVGATQLKNYINRKVLFVGKIESVDNGLVNMQAPDGSRVNIQTNSHYEAPFVEIEGVVVDPMTIREESHVSFGDNFGELQLLARAHVYHAAPPVRKGTLATVSSSASLLCLASCEVACKRAGTSKDVLLFWGPCRDSCVHCCCALQTSAYTTSCSSCLRGHMLSCSTHVAFEAAAVGCRLITGSNTELFSCAVTWSSSAVLCC